MQSGFRIYDTHSHFGVARHSGRRCGAEETLRHMEAAGVERSLLLPCPAIDYHARHEEIEAAEDLGFGDVKLQPQYQGLNPLSSRSEFPVALERGTVLICHTGTGAPFAIPSLFIVPARKFRSLDIVLGHVGGNIYFAEAIVAVTVCPNFFVELSSSMVHHVQEVLAYVPVSRPLIGSGLPESLEIETGKTLGLRLAEDGKRDILWNTGRRLFDGAGE